MGLQGGRTGAESCCAVVQREMVRVTDRTGSRRRSEGEERANDSDITAEERQAYTQQYQNKHGV